MKKRKRLKRKLDVKSKKVVKKSSKRKKSRSSKRRYDSKKLQNRLKRSQERAQGGMKSVVSADAEVQMYRPKDGGHIVDIIPYEAGEFDPIVEEGDPTYTLEIWVHPQVGVDKQVVLCMERMFNEQCDICDHRQALRDKGADEEIWKKLWPKGRHLYNVVSYDKGEEEKGVQIWDVSYHYSEKHIIPLSKRPTRGGKERTVNFADPVDGKSIAFTIEPAKSKNDYPSYTGWAFEDRDYEIDDEIMDDVYCLDEIIHIPKAKEVSNAYWGKDGKKKGRGSKRDRDDDDNDDESLEELIEEVEDMDDMDDLEDFIDEHDLDVKIKRKDDEEDVQEKIVDALKEEYEDDDDDNGNDDDEPDYTKKEIRKMKKRKLLKIIEEEDLDIDEDDAEDTEELQDMVIEELEL